MSKALRRQWRAQMQLQREQEVAEQIPCQIKNLTGRPERINPALIDLIPNEWVPVPAEIAAYYQSQPGYEVFVPVNEQTPWKDDDRRFSLYFLAPFVAADGYGSQAEDLVLAFDKLDVKLTARCLWRLNPWGLEQRTLELLGAPQRYLHEVGLCYAPPDSFALLPTKYRVGLTMTETTDPTAMWPQWIWQINEIDLLLTPSEWGIKTWRECGVSIPIKYVEAPASHHFYSYRHRQPRDTFTVITWATMVIRKCPHETVEVFQRAFPQQEYPDCRLIIKTRDNWFSTRGSMPRFDDPRIQIINADYLPEQMVELAMSADVMLYLSRGEGCGRPPREAMALGLPLICADNTGMRAICNSDFMIPIPTKTWEPAAQGGEWAVPDWDAAVDALRWSYNNREKHIEMARLGAGWFGEHFSPEACAKGIITAIDEMMEAGAPPKGQKKSWEEFYQPMAPETVRFIQEHHAHFFETVQQLVPPPARLLEIGVGTGAFYGKLMEMGYQVVAVDNDPKVIEVAKENLRQVGIEETTIIEADAFELPDSLGRFDLGYSQGTLEHFEDEDIIALLEQQFKVADRVAFSVPSTYYPTRDTGTERLVRLRDWEAFLKTLEFCHPRSAEYYGGARDRFHVLAVLEPGPSIRGIVRRRL